ncbi:MAG: hypothetical protein P4N41_11130 [Negativicutes bacterium]|nr:hypothetical protein [Negativicutes bacterium]
MDKQRALVVLSPYESRRLIAKAVAKLPAVQKAFRDGWIIIATGSSTGYVAEEILGEPMVKENFVSGHITGGELWGTPKNNPAFIFPVVLHKGERLFMKPEDALPEFSAEDVFIKGANAVDAEYRTAVFTANDMGGTMGWAMGPILARGSQLIMPVGLEKMVASVPEAAKHCGIKSFTFSTGLKVGMAPVVTATVITEIQALAQLCDVEAYHMGGGGIAGAEGSVVLALEGQAAKVAAAFEFIRSIKGEKPLAHPNGTPSQ